MASKMSPFLRVIIFLWAFNSVLVVRGQDNSGCLEHIKGYSETAFGNHVFYISTETKSWSDAKTNCEELGGRLAVLNNKTALIHVRKVLKDLVRDENKNFWIGLQWNKINQSYYWLSGETHDHEGNEDWTGGNDDSTGSFVAMVPPKFLFNNRADLLQFYNFVCEKKRTVWPIGRHGDKDFYVVNRTMTWSEGQHFCEACEKAHLAEIRDEETQTFLQTNLTSAVPDLRLQLHWMGLRGNRSSPDNVSWAWSTGEELECGPSSNSYPCRTIQQISLGVMEWSCVGLHNSTRSFRWGSENCTSKAGVLCERGIHHPETSTPKGVTSSTTAEVTISTTEEVTSIDSDAAGTSSAIPLSSTSTMATTTEETTGETNHSQGTEFPKSYIIVIGVVIACIVVAALVAVYFTKKRRQTRSMKDAELVSMTRQALAGTDRRFDNSTYGEQLPLSSEENLRPVYSNTHGLEATGGSAVPMGDPVQERGKRDGSSDPDAETYDHAFQSRPVAREATGNVYGHLQDANATGTDTETYDHAFNAKTTKLQSGGGSDCYGHLSPEGKTDSDDPYDSTAQTRSREATGNNNAYDHLPVGNSGVTSPDSDDPTDPVYIN